MDRSRVGRVLPALKRGRPTVRPAVGRVRGLPRRGPGVAEGAAHRAVRRGFPEVVYCPGKTDAQVARIAQRLAANSDVVLATRATANTSRAVKSASKGTPVAFDDTAQMIALGGK